MRPRHPLADTYEQILREQLPNLFRLYLNPYVTQTCFCLARYVQGAWDRQPGEAGEYQTFLANGFDDSPFDDQIGLIRRFQQALEWLDGRSRSVQKPQQGSDRDEPCEWRHH